ncbi:MAG: hypothetical protein COU67_03615 [Candidatus Pacebacteria bacterium CG10_big_fil_rev_8_21_14_0_10_44_54]|nr:MAG: hypothetical protein COU67_03615 [Candidatus Pacebacteria bacterium CG10_big_fil_rev_8_21_14_0_10_44_54]
MSPSQQATTIGYALDLETTGISLGFQPKLAGARIRGWSNRFYRTFSGEADNPPPSSQDKWIQLFKQGLRLLLHHQTYQE